jgi:hypothetical protein
MPPSDPSSNTGKTQRRSFALPRFRFSLAWLLIGITIVAVVLGLAHFVGPAFGFVFKLVTLAIACIVPTPLIICAVFGRGYVRAFSIGAIVPWVIGLRWDESVFASITLLLITVTLSAVCGIVGASTLYYLRLNEER